MSQTPEQLYQARQKLIEDAIALKPTERVPVSLALSYFPAKYVDGVTCEDAFYNPEKWQDAVLKTIADFQPDVCLYSGLISGKALEAFDLKLLLWPGHGTSCDHTHQYVEGEYMKADEYDKFFADPSDYMIRTYLPRACGNLQDLARLPSLQRLFGYPLLTALLGMPALDGIVETLGKVRRESMDWTRRMAPLDGRVRALGMPSLFATTVIAPFDTVSDNWRGMRGSMLDMYRQPENLLKAVDYILPLSLESAIGRARMSGNPRVFIPLHRGAEGFMSIKQFETFYWPTLKALMLGLIEAGLTPCPFFEGDYTSRLEYLLELPKGKVLGHFDTTDIFRAKEVLDGHLCIQGNVPCSLLQAGTPEDVKAYCKQLIDVVGKGGGLIVMPRSSIDEARPENIRAMIDFTKEYGVYS